MPKRHIAIYGPLPPQFQRVLSKLSRQLRKEYRFSCFGSDKHKQRVTNADLHVVWTKFIQHATQSAIEASGGTMRLIVQFNKDTLLDAIEKGFGLKAEDTPKPCPAAQPSKARKKKRKKKGRRQ